MYVPFFLGLAKWSYFYTLFYLELYIFKYRKCPETKTCFGTNILRVKLAIKTTNYFGTIGSARPYLVLNSFTYTPHPKRSEGTNCILHTDHVALYGKLSTFMILTNF